MIAPYRTVTLQSEILDPAGQPVRVVNVRLPVGDEISTIISMTFNDPQAGPFWSYVITTLTDLPWLTGSGTMLDEDMTALREAMWEAIKAAVQPRIAGLDHKGVQ